MSAETPIEPMCTAGLFGPCDRPAVAAMHVHYAPARQLPTILIRPDHLANPELALMQWRCVECLHHEIDEALGFRPIGAS